MRGGGAGGDAAGGRGGGADATLGLGGSAGALLVESAGNGINSRQTAQIRVPGLFGCPFLQ